MSAPRITAVVFDLGGVLSIAPFEALDAYGSELGLAADALSTGLLADPEFDALQVGAITGREFFKGWCTRIEAVLGVRVDIHRLAAATEAGGELNPLMLDLVRDLHARYTLGLLTNNVKESVGWRDVLDDRLFDVVIDSSAVGMKKPDPRIYELLLSQLTRPAAEVVFVDDFAENLPPAAAMGIHTIQFLGVDDCRRALAALGVE